MKIYPSDLRLVRNCPGMATFRDDLRETGVTSQVRGMTNGLAAHIWIETYLDTSSREKADQETHTRCVDQMSPSTMAQILDECHRFADWLPEMYRQGTQEIRLAWELGEHTVSGRVDWLSVDGTRLADWKRYEDPSMLDSVADDWQMRSYGALAGAVFKQEVVDVDRVLIIQRRVETVRVDVAATLSEMGELVGKVATNEKKAGTWCKTCYVRHWCPEFRALGGVVEDLQPYRGGPIQADQALYWLTRLQAAKDRVEELEKALKAHADRHGGIADPATGRVWLNKTYHYDKMSDHLGAYGRLVEKVGPEVAARHCFLSKKSVVDALTAAGWEKLETKVFLDELRAAGMMDSREGNKYQWGKGPSKNGEAKCQEDK